MESGFFPSEWKKGIVVPIHKKDGKRCFKNYHPVSLLPICGKIFEKLIFNEMFKCFIENELISPNQSGFKSDDSCINQLYLLLMKYTNQLTKALKLAVFFSVMPTNLHKAVFEKVKSKSKSVCRKSKIETNQIKDKTLITLS